MTPDTELLILRALAFLCQEAERGSKYGSSKEGLQIRVDLDTAIKLASGRRPD